MSSYFHTYTPDHLFPTQDILYSGKFSGPVNRTNTEYSLWMGAKVSSVCSVDKHLLEHYQPDTEQITTAMAMCTISCSPKYRV